MNITLMLMGFSLPVMLLTIGLIFSKHPPKKINSFAGYRTSRSMKNAETWSEANKYSSQLMIRFSLYLLAITALCMIFAGSSSDYTVAVLMGISILLIVFMIIIIVKTENHLKKMFEE